MNRVWTVRLFGVAALVVFAAILLAGRFPAEAGIVAMVGLSALWGAIALGCVAIAAQGDNFRTDP